MFCLLFIGFIMNGFQKSEYETTTKPSYAIYKKLDFLDESGEFDLSFYVSINF